MMMHPPPPPPKPTPITIFVHGTQVHALFKDVDIRKFFPANTQSPAGLNHAQDLPHDHAIHHLLNALTSADSNHFSPAGMYTFGWSGGIEVKERRAAGKQLFDLIQSLAQTYHDLHGSNPEITVITHSHGGNVVLHMAEHYHEHNSFSIARVLLLACPVQELTSFYVQSPLFKKIYALHSHDDRFQIMDQRSLQLPRSVIDTWRENRQVKIQELIKTIQNVTWKFGSERHFAVQPNIIQAEITWHSAPHHDPQNVDNGLFMELKLYEALKMYKEISLRDIINMYKAIYTFSFQERGLLHTEFTTPSFFKHIPTLMRELDEKKAADKAQSLCITHSIAGRS
jgi:hypothetical protein